MEYLSEDAVSVTESPSDIPQFAGQTFEDLMWKAQAAFHHCVRIVELEHVSTSLIEDRARTLEQDSDINWLTIARQPVPLIRFEYEALLNALYSFLNVLAKALCEVVFERRGSYPSFRSRLVKSLKRNAPGPRQAIADRVVAVLEAAKGESPELFSRGSARDRVSHDQHLRHRPTQVSRTAPARVTVTHIDGESVSLSAEGQITVSVFARWVPAMSVMEFTVFQEGADEHFGESVDFHVVRAGEQRVEMSFAERAASLTSGALKIAAGTLDAIDGGRRADAAEVVAQILERLLSAGESVAADAHLARTELQLLEGGRVAFGQATHKRPTSAS